MPYQGERANKNAHSDFVKNPDVVNFLNQCEYLREPSDEEVKRMTDSFVEPPAFDKAPLPSSVIAIDGSLHESSINDRLPSTKVGYVKIGTVLIDMKQYKELRVEDGRFVDPFKVARLEENNQPITFTLPSSNIRWNKHDSVKNSFRAMVDHSISDQRTRFGTELKYSLRTTLFHLAALRPEGMGSDDPSILKLHKCPVCERGGPIILKDIEGPQYCLDVGGCEIFPSDCLRLWEEVSDYQSNMQAISRFMNIVEHMVPIHYIRYLTEHSLKSLSGIAFFVDGPLAVFGTAAWIHRSIMQFLAITNEKLVAAGHEPILVIGLQKTGQVVDHAAMVDRYIPPGRLFAINDDYRYTYILGGRDPAANGFGDETYYGQDFIYKTETGRTFVFGLPFNAKSKQPKEDFLENKTKFESHPTLTRALALIKHFESDLYKNALVPVALAHKYTAISLRPGGRVLDLLTRKGLAGE